METFQFKVSIKADRPDTASRKVNAVLKIIDRLSVEQVEKIAKLIESNPDKLAQYLTLLGA